MEEWRIPLGFTLLPSLPLSLPLSVPPCVATATRTGETCWGLYRMETRQEGKLHLWYSTLWDACMQGKRTRVEANFLSYSQHGFCLNNNKSILISSSPSAGYFLIPSSPLSICIQWKLCTGELFTNYSTMTAKTKVQISNDRFCKM